MPAKQWGFRSCWAFQLLASHRLSPTFWQNKVHLQACGTVVWGRGKGKNPSPKGRRLEVRQWPLITHKLYTDGELGESTTFCHNFPLECCYFENFYLCIMLFMLIFFQFRVWIMHFFCSQLWTVSSVVSSPGGKLWGSSNVFKSNLKLYFYKYLIVPCTITFVHVWLKGLSPMGYQLFTYLFHLLAWSFSSAEAAQRWRIVCAQ